jgi:predicted MFS family arabinose efflux permease
MTVATSALVFVVSVGPNDGWSSPATVLAVPILLAAVTSLIKVEGREPEPLLDRSLMRRTRILVPLAVAACQSMVGIAWLYLLTLHFQEVLRLDPLLSGLAFAPMTAASIVGAAMAGRVIRRYGARRTMIVGSAAMTLGLAALAAALFTGGQLATVVAGTVIGETGFMLATVAVTLTITSRLPDRHSGLAAGLLNTATQLGGGVGLAIVSAAVTAAVSTGTTGTSSLAAGFLTCIAFGVLACASAWKVADQAESVAAR